MKNLYKDAFPAFRDLLGQEVPHGGADDLVPALLETFRKEIVRSRALTVTGKLEKKDGVVNVIGHKFEPLTLNGEKIRLRSRDFR